MSFYQVYLRDAAYCSLIAHQVRESFFEDIGEFTIESCKGDGIVDLQDLIVLAEHLCEEVSRPGR
jgi:hypothetical protein